MKLVVLGTAGYHPNEHRHTTCVMIPDYGIVFDAGSSFFRLPNHLETDSVDIFLSHSHLDHVIGLTFLLDILYQYQLEEVRVHGEEEKLRAIRKHLFAPELFPVAPPYVDRPISCDVSDENGVVRVSDAKITCKALTHPGNSLGYRVDWPDRSMAFITDTTADQNADYVDFIRGVDLLVHECNFPDGLEELALKTGHSCLTSVAKVAKKADVGGLVLLHFDPLTPGLDADAVQRAETIFSPIVLAEDGMEIEL